MDAHVESQITPVAPVPMGTGEVVSVAPPPPLEPLSSDEEMFALAVVEFSGNLKAAYLATFGQDSVHPLARGRALMAKPSIAARVTEISTDAKGVTMVTLGTHLHELAEIRDLAKVSGQLKVALTAERSRGEAVGIYNEFVKGRSTAPVAVQINFASKHDEAI